MNTKNFYLHSIVICDGLKCTTLFSCTPGHSFVNRNYMDICLGPLTKNQYFIIYYIIRMQGQIVITYWGHFVSDKNSEFIYRTNQRNAWSAVRMLRVLVHVNVNSFKTMMTFGNMISERPKSIGTVRVLGSVMGVAIICALRYELCNYSIVSELIDIDNILQLTYLKHRENSGKIRMLWFWPLAWRWRGYGQISCRPSLLRVHALGSEYWEIYILLPCLLHAW